MAEQRQLFGEQRGRPDRLKDFELLPALVWPTTVGMLHQGGDFLFHRNADAVRKVTPMQDAMFKRLARMSEPCRHCGNLPDTGIQVVACTGIEGKDRDRLIAWYDHMHNDEKLRLAGDGEIPHRIADWFNAREGRR